MNIFAPTMPHFKRAMRLSNPVYLIQINETVCLYVFEDYAQEIGVLKKMWGKKGERLRSILGLRLCSGGRRETSLSLSGLYAFDNAFVFVEGLADKVEASWKNRGNCARKEKLSQKKLSFRPGKVTLSHGSFFFPCAKKRPRTPRNFRRLNLISQRKIPFHFK